MDHEKKVPGENLSRRLSSRVDLEFTKGHPLLEALANAQAPEDLVSIVESSSGVEELPSPIRRIVDLIKEESRRTDSVIVNKQVKDPDMTFMAPSARVNGSNDNTMKLARRLQRLVLLAEADRRILEARRSVRMAEDTAEARQKADFSAPGGKKRPVDVEALAREVLENVTRMKESRQERRSEDPDDISIWW